LPATDRGATTIKAVLARAKLDPAKVGTAVTGNVMQAGKRMNPARQSPVVGGILVQISAMTVSRVRGSGAKVIASAAQEPMLGTLTRKSGHPRMRCGAGLANRALAAVSSQVPRASTTEGTSGYRAYAPKRGHKP
jgi:hypothetical protein